MFVYAKNFMTSCKKLLDLNYEFRRGGSLGLDYEGRHVTVRIGHVGIEKQNIDEVLTTQEFSKFYSSLQGGKLKNKILMASVDYMHPISGIQNKLRAFYNFLSENPRMVSKVILVQYAVPQRMAGEQLKAHSLFKRSRDEIQALVQKITKTFGSKVLYFKEEGTSQA